MKKIGFKRSFLLGGMIFFLFSCTFNLAKKNDKTARYIAEDSTYPREMKEGLYYTDLGPKNTFELGSNAKVVFNLPPYTNPGNVGILPLMLNTINNAKHSIRMSVFQFNHKEVFNALIKAAERKVKIFIATDLCYSGKVGYKEYFDELRSKLNTLGQNGETQVIDDKTPSCETMFNHNKYMIVDYEDEKLAKAWFGSFNPTNHGAQENVELSILANNKKLAEILKLDFDQQMSGVFKVNKKGVYEVAREGKSEIQALSEQEVKEFIKNKVKITYPKVIIGSTQFEFIFSPKVKSLSRIVEEVYKAKKEILFSSFAIADQMLISSLINKSKTSSSKYNLFSILMLPHPGDESGPEFVYNGDNGNKKLISNQNELTSIVDEIKNNYATPTNYLTPKSELKSTFKYIYPKGSAGGEILKVHVEGIFNSKIIDEKNTYQRLLSHSVPLYKSSLYGELHNKLFLIDGETTIFGSHNFSQSAENSNDELTVIIKSSALTSFLRQELYFKTKAMSVSENRPMPSFTGRAGVILTEIMSESEYKMKWNNKVADIGDYIELYNFSDYPVNLLGFRIDDHYFPENNNEKLDISTLQGVQSTLVRFYPNKTLNTLGGIDNNPKNNILMPGQTALIVGKYFHESFYKKKFEDKFLKLNKRSPKESEYPILFSSNEYFSSVLGDSATGLSSKDKVSLFGIDGMTVIDRFSYPKKTKLGSSLERSIDLQKLKSLLNSRNYELRSLNFSLKNGTSLVDRVFAPIPDYNNEGEWMESEESGSPGVVSGLNRGPSSTSNLFTVEGEVVDVHTNSFKSGLVVIKDGKILDITSIGNSKYPAPLIRDVLIYPGLIDAHNHIKYNTMPIWTVNKVYNNRDEWPNEIVYKNAIKEIYKGVYSNWPECNSTNELDSNKCLAQKRCQILFFAELKALVGGTTSIQGSSSFDESSSDITFKGLSGYTAGSGNSLTKSKARQLEDLLDSCSNNFARNIEREKWRGSDIVRTTAQSIYADAWAKNSLIDPVKSKQGPSYKLSEEFKNKVTEKFFIHLGEGKDSYSLSEYTELKVFKLNVPETTVIHGTAFDDSVLSDMGKNGISLAWSPTSNLLLYKKTTDIPSALKNKVNVALGSDWSLSGTKSLLDELKVAVKVNEKYFNKAISKSELLKMVTINGARASGVVDLIGSVEKNKLADFFIVQNSEKVGTPLDTLVKITEDKILSVFVGGRPLVGKSEVLSSFQSENVTKIDDGSCSENLYINMDKNTFDSVISNLSSKTEKSFLSLSPKLKNAVGEDFKFLDPICGKKDERYQKILNSL